MTSLNDLIASIENNFTVTEDAHGNAPLVLQKFRRPRDNIPRKIDTSLPNEFSRKCLSQENLRTQPKASPSDEGSARDSITQESTNRDSAVRLKSSLHSVTVSIYLDSDDGDMSELEDFDNSSRSSLRSSPTVAESQSTSSLKPTGVLANTDLLPIAEASRSALDIGDVQSEDSSADEDLDEPDGKKSKKKKKKNKKKGSISLYDQRCPVSPRLRSASIQGSIAPLSLETSPQPSTTTLSRSQVKSGPVYIYSNSPLPKKNHGFMYRLFHPQSHSNNHSAEDGPSSDQPQSSANTSPTMSPPATRKASTPQGHRLSGGDDLYREDNSGQTVIRLIHYPADNTRRSMAHYEHNRATLFSKLFHLHGFESEEQSGEAKECANTIPTSASHHNLKTLIMEGRALGAEAASPSGSIDSSERFPSPTSPSSVHSPQREAYSSAEQYGSSNNSIQSPRSSKMSLSGIFKRPRSFSVQLGKDKPQEREKRAAATLDRKDHDRKDSNSEEPSLFKDMMEKRHRRGYSITAKKSIESVDSDDGPYNLKDSVSRKSLVSRPNNEPQDTGKKTIKRSRSESSMAEKYGKVDEVLGKGANATVRLAHLKETKKNSPTCPEKLYAIKEFRKRRKDETKKEYVKKLIAEFCISSSLHHPNVVETVDLLQDERNKWCVVMEYLSGGDLFARISVGGPITTEEANCFFKQLLSGVAYMHSMGVAHRDLKPENLLLDERCQILKITDFGVSTVFRTCFETKPRPVKGCCGSEPYIAPEEWEDEREYDPVKVDVWACAIIYYVMNSKMVPWRCSKASDPNYSIYLRQRPKSAQVVSGFPRFDQLQHQAQRKVLYRCLDPNPNTRDSISDILDDDYFRKTDMCIVAYDNHGECVALPPVRHTHTASKPH